ncbi:hypothetical protein M422DRAFT_37420 [Sphaerobolus stellatus SS14]|uniref:6-phosphofructo-2-kinase domain-containing protein n=1 Tax=Sphaerobolus stellatus (strain SS14) TaxID=990650 RepID=A0A0C9UGR2_SPHS4|nr:hypothetical protein M422DRAFT_37420 [Sphaerobolus stellatus SS14]
MVAPLYTTASGLLFHAGKIIVVTVGLPARGKTHISRALERYLRWMGVKTQVISLGDYRRKVLGGTHNVPKDYFTLGEKSPETEALRARVKEGCEDLIWEFFEKGGQVVIYDANNGTVKARNELAEKFDKQGVHVIFLESVLTSDEIVEANIRSVKISSPDYKGTDPEEAVRNYWSRIKDHEKHYEPVVETNWPFIRIINVGEKIMVNNIQGYLQSRIVFFLMNIHNKYRTIYFARSGQSLIEHSYKADSDLSPAGWDYSERLKDFVLERRAKTLESRGLSSDDRRLVIWTSARRRAHHTAWPFLSVSRAQNPLGPSTGPSPTPSPSSSPFLPATNPSASFLSPSMFSLLPASVAPTPPPMPRVKVVEKPQMTEINPGVWDGLSPDEAKVKYPEDWERFLKDPYAFRAPRAESYHDLSVRLEPILIELEREQEDLLIISHASVIRCLLAYLIGLPASEIPAIEIARGDLIEVVPASYGVHSRAFHFWDGPGRRHGGVPASPRVSSSGGSSLTLDGDVEDVEAEDGVQEGEHHANFYENFAEDTKYRVRSAGASGEAGSGTPIVEKADAK